MGRLIPVGGTLSLARVVWSGVRAAVGALPTPRAAKEREAAEAPRLAMRAMARQGACLEAGPGGGMARGCGRAVGRAEGGMARGVYGKEGRTSGCGRVWPDGRRGRRA